jgi:hypothetical protein
MCFACVLESTEIIQINVLIFVLETRCASCEAENEFSHIINMKFVFQSFKRQFQGMFIFVRTVLVSFLRISHIKVPACDICFVVKGPAADATDALQP